MTEEKHSLTAGAGGPWEVYRAQIKKGVERGDDPKVIEALHRKLARSIDKWGDPDVKETK
jgi:hypothetical protein